MSIPTEPIGSIPRPPELMKAAQELAAGRISQEAYREFLDRAVRETIEQFEATGSPVITDGEQGKPGFATYPIEGLPNLAPDGVVIPFADHHTRQLPRLTAGPFRYLTHADSYLEAALRHAHVPVKAAVISASALSLLYPQDGIEGYSRDAFLLDLVREATADIRGCLDGGAHNVQIDFTEARLSLKLDPSQRLLQSFIDINNRVFDQFSADDRLRIGVHTCPGGDKDSTHSADVDYAELLPSLFALHAGTFYIQLASEADRRRVLGVIKKHAKPKLRIFVGVIDPLNPRIETAEEVKRPDSGSSGVHRPKSAGHLRRLRIFPLRRRRLDWAGDCIREDTGAGGGNQPGGTGARPSGGRSDGLTSAPRFGEVCVLTAK